MDRQAADLKWWKEFFDSSKSDLWTVIDRAITLAALEQPAELRARRDKYTEKLFCPTSHLAGLCECEDDEAEEDEEDEDRGDNNTQTDNKNKDNARDSESDVSTRHGKGEEQDDAGSNEEQRRKSSRGCSYMDVEALSDEMEEESRRMKEISKLKARISNPDEYEDYLCEDLEALERMNISFEQLKTSEIGRPVNNLRKHPSASVRAIVKRLIKNWKALADEWARSAEHVTARGSYGTNDDDYGLPSPPVDEGELLAAGSAPLEQLFDFMEDDLSGGSGAEMNSQLKGDNSPVDLVNGIYEDAHSPADGGYASKQQQQLKKPLSSDLDRQRTRKDSSAATLAKSTGEHRDHSKRSTPSIPKPTAIMNGKNESNRNSSTTTAGARLAKSTSAAPSSSSGLQRSKPAARPRPEDRMTSSNKNKSFADEGKDKLAAAKRKLYEGYQQAENAKKQRTVQVMELTELPKGKGGPKAISKAKAHPQHNHRYSSSNHIRR